MDDILTLQFTRGALQLLKDWFDTNYVLDSTGKRLRFEIEEFAPGRATLNFSSEEVFED